MPGDSDGSASGTAASANEDRGSGFWTLLPSFDPSADDPREYRDKVTFLKQVCPTKDRGMLAPRLALLCKGTAWSQVKQIEAAKLTDPESGVEVLLQALASWDESAELQTYERFDKAIYRTLQKNDESTMSFMNRLGVAFHELGDKITIKELQAFILLRQSSLTSEDKRKVITLTGGTLEIQKVEQAMRTLSTKILSSAGEIKKKTYPANYVDDDEEDINLTEEDADEESLLANVAEAGDEDAIFVLEYEDQILDLVQELPELASCFSAYTAARQRLRDRHKGRGFWPPRSASKGGKGKGGGKKGRGKGNPLRKSLAERIASSNCRICGQRGHWRAECPQNKGSSSDNQGPETSNLVMYASETVDEPEIMDKLPFAVAMTENENQPDVKINKPPLESILGEPLIGTDDASLSLEIAEAPNFANAIEQAKLRRKKAAQEETERTQDHLAHMPDNRGSGTVMPKMSQGYMKDTLDEKDQKPLPPRRGQRGTSASSSSQKRATSWDVIENEQLKGMSQDGGSQEQIMSIQTQIAILQRELSRLQGEQ
ncbi:unnamed protein product [Symbiodinium pilosum]|uniref:CCHC-type domain-containing protein n=1 Tax=Symbiodinium pilosum TaxID=2952 RepID=A0A812K5R5_SYMPI|nr:unnamed protein product [Symbiodinium pilosum]